MTTTRHSFTSIATALAMAAALIAAMGPRVEADDSESDEFTLTITAVCEDDSIADWSPYWYQLVSSLGTEDVEEDEDGFVVGDATEPARITVYTDDVEGEFEIQGDIDLDWGGIDGCDDEPIDPTGTVSVAVDLGDPGPWWLSIVVDEDDPYLCVAGCAAEQETDGDVDYEQLVSFRLSVTGKSSGEATVTITVTWDPGADPGGGE